MTAFEVPEGMPLAVFQNKYSRLREDGEFQSWAERVREVVDGNFSLAQDHKTEYTAEDYRRTHELAKQGILPFSGRHLQHGGLDQKDKLGELFVNCATSMLSFVKFWLLLKGEGVGRCYDSDLCRVNWDNMPNVRLVIEGPDPVTGEDGHPDYESWIETVQEAQHKYDSESERVRWFTVGDSAEGWAKVVEILETASFQEKHKNKLYIFDFSKVRKRGAPIRGQQNRPGSGPVPLIRALNQIISIKGAGMKPWKQACFVDHYLAACVVCGGIRRSSRIAVKSWRDRDIFDFIDLKRGGWLRTANNSVSVDAEFWESSQTPAPSHARRVFEAMASAGYFDQTGEPGFVNLERMSWNDEGLEDITPENLLNKRTQDLLDLHPRTLEMIDSLLEVAKRKKYPYIVNPCVTKDCWILTRQGPRQISELLSEPFEAVVGGKFYPSTPFFPTGVKEVLRLETTRGFSARLTENHKVLVLKGKTSYKENITEWVEAGDLIPGDRVFLSNQRSFEGWPGEGTFEEGWLVGEILGDGGFNPEKYPTYLRFWGESKEEMAAVADSRIRGLGLPLRSDFLGGFHSAHHNTLTLAARCLDTLAIRYLEPKVKRILKSIEGAGSDFYKGFLRGLFDADGSVQGSTEKGISVRLSQSCREVLSVAQRMLARLGIASTVYLERRAAGFRRLPDGRGGHKKSWTKANHELVIARDNVEEFQKRVGFEEPEKKGLLCALVSSKKRVSYRESWTTEVKAIYPEGEEEVYDCTVEESHEFDGNGLRLHNCGEIILAVWGGYCTIGDICLANCRSLEDGLDAARLVAQFLVRVNRMSYLYEAEVKRTNRIGVGITGIHEFAYQFFGYTFRDLLDEERSADFWGHVEKMRLSAEGEAARYSRQIGVSVPHTVTCVKPSGCRPWYGLVSTTKGLLTLEELFENHPVGKEWASYEGGAEVLQGGETQKISRTFANGLSTLVKIRMTYGLTVESTPEHPWFVSEKYKRYGPNTPVNKWVPAARIQEGDILQVNLSAYDVEESSFSFSRVDSLSLRMRLDAYEITQPPEMTTEIAWLIGYLWGDGAQSLSKYRLRFTDQRKENLEKARKILINSFGLPPMKTHPASEGRDAFVLEVGSKLLWAWMIRNDIQKLYAGKIDLIPKCVRASAREHILAFIAGLMDADGCAFVVKGRKKTLTLSTASKLFADHLQQVCWSVGLGIGCSHNNTLGQSFQRRKSMYLLTLGAHVRKKSFASLLRHSLKVALCHERNPDLPWSFEVTSKNIGVLGKVKSVEEGEPRQTYDVEVEENQWFFAGSVRSHNTVSKVLACTEGAHLPAYDYYVRWVQYHVTDPDLKKYKALGYPVKDISHQYREHVVVGFPTQMRASELMGDDVVVAGEATPEEQYRWLQLLEKYWIGKRGNNISYTLKYDPEVVGYEEFMRTLLEYQKTVRGCTVMPQTDLSAYAYVPEERISKERYGELMAGIFRRAQTEDYEENSLHCEGGSCPIELDLDRGPSESSRLSSDLVAEAV